MWVLIYWIFMSDVHGGVTTGQVQFATLNACHRAKEALTRDGYANIRAVCVEHD